MSGVRALAFDVFGTVVDWRGTIIREGAALSREWGVEVDWAAFADAWRGLYQPAMERVRTGGRGWVKLDVLHRENLDELLPRFGLDGLDETQRDHLNRVWHRLDPWPDAVQGITRLKRAFVVAPLSNGNVALIVDMAKRAGLPWDLVLGAEVARAYKPMPEAYLNAADLLDLEPGQVMMVATHNSDLEAASAAGLRTAYVHRPDEFGAGSKADEWAWDGVDVEARDFLELADRLGA